MTARRRTSLTPTAIPHSTGQQNVYDFENRLVQRGGVSIVYDGDGNRVQETVAGVTTKYLVGEVNPTGYVQVFAELSGTNSLLRGYEWGLQLEAVRDFTVNSFGIFHYYGHDGHGSVRWLTDSNGATTDTYDYDAFGNLISSTGTTFNNYLFAGEQFDPALGIYYNRARYYDQRQGRFWTADTFEGDSQSPASLHRYLYVSADPIDRFDPSGNFDIAETLTVAAVATTVNNIEFINGQATMDQIKYGGNAGIKSLAINGLIVLGVPIAIKAVGRLLRAVPFQRLALPVGQAARVVTNALEPEEAAFAEEVVSFRGGTFVGNLKRYARGIDGLLNDVIPASLKVLSTRSVQTLVDRVNEGYFQALNAGYSGVEIFVSAKNLSFAEVYASGEAYNAINSVLTGTVSAVNILFSGGWVRFL